MALTVAELEAVYTANADKFDRVTAQVEGTIKRLVGLDPEVTLSAEQSQALAKIDQTTKQANAFGNLSAAARLDADDSGAISAIRTAEGAGSDFDGETFTAKADVDTSNAKDALGDLEDQGSKTGDETGKNVMEGIVAGLASIPIAGAIIGVGAAIGKGVLDGFKHSLQIEADVDMFAARTGLDPTTTQKLGRVAGEAYADNFGDSVADNLETARAAIGAGLLDPKATARASQEIIEQLDGVATILGEDIPKVARSAGQILRNGLAPDAEAAFDLIVKAQYNGLNIAEDLLDTVDEYSTKFRDLGLSGEEALGLIQQGFRGGARDADVMADALKEFQISMVDGSTTTAAALETLGMNADDMRAKFLAGGDTAKTAFGDVLTAIAAIEDPTVRSNVQLALFKTKAEDIGQALNSLDLGSAAAEFGEFAGTTSHNLDVMSDNAATSLQGAQRNIEVAADGIMGALAQAFGPQIQEFADSISSNRAGIMKFLLGVANGAINIGRTMVEGLASATEAVGDFLGGPAAQLLNGMANIVMGIDAMAPGDQGGKAFREWADDAIVSLGNADDALEKTADGIRENLIEKGLDPAQQRLNEFGDSLILDAEVHDSQMRTAQAIDTIGTAAEQAGVSLKDLTDAQLLSTETSAGLGTEIGNVKTKLIEELEAARRNGEGTADLQARVSSATDSLKEQLTALGLTDAQAQALIDTYLGVPGQIITDVLMDTQVATKNINDLQADASSKQTMPVDANTKPADDSVSALIRGISLRKAVLRVDAKGNQTVNFGPGKSVAWADGGISYFAGGGLPENHIAQIARAAEVRVWAEPETGGEAYIPLHESKRGRSTAILGEVARQFGYRLMPDTTRHYADGYTPPVQTPAFPSNLAEDIATAVVQAFTAAHLTLVTSGVGAREAARLEIGRVATSLAGRS